MHSKALPFAVEIEDLARGSLRKEGGGGAFYVMDIFLVQHAHI
jgi:hypothetical protein